MLGMLSWVPRALLSYSRRTTLDYIRSLRSVGWLVTLLLVTLLVSLLMTLLLVTLLLWKAASLIAAPGASSTTASSALILLVILMALATSHPYVAEDHAAQLIL